MEPATKASTRSVARFLPILGWLPTYRPAWLRSDLMAGITVGAFAVPENLAYAGLAGLPVQYGMYASMMAMAAYAFFGTSRQLAVGATSALSIMVAGTLGALALSPDDYVNAAQFTAIIVAVLAIGAGLLRAGFVVNFISESVLTGFKAGAALFIASSQLAKLFGIEGVQGNFFERIWNVLSHLDETNGWALGLGLIGIALLLGGERRFPKLPVALIVVLLSIALMSFTDLAANHGIKLAGHIPSGFPDVGIPSFPSGYGTELTALAFGCFLLSYVEGFAAARAFATRHKYKIDPDQELIACGAANLAGGVGQGYVVGGSMSRSAVSDSSGAKTPLAGGFAAILLLIVMLFLTGIFSDLPETILAAVVLVAVRSLIDVPALRRLAQLSRVEFGAAMLTLLGVLTFDMLKGIIIGTVFSLLALVYRASRPHIAVLGRIPGTDAFGDIHRHPENQVVPGVLAYRVDGTLFYANASAVKEDVLSRVEGQDPPISLVVLALDATPSIDLSAIDMLEELAGELTGRNVQIRVADVDGPVRDTLRQAGLADELGLNGTHTTIPGAIAAWQATRDGERSPQPASV
jgi:sulfate permease, SulP family